MSETKDLIEFSELWFNSAQEGEPIAQDEIELVKDLIAALKSQKAIIDDQNGTIETFKFDNKKMHELYNKHMTESVKKGIEIESLKAITELSVKELQFYADGTNYDRHENDRKDGLNNPSSYDIDFGKRARTTLSEIERLTHIQEGETE